MKQIFLRQEAGKKKNTRQPASRIIFGAGLLYLILSWPAKAQVLFEETAPRRYHVVFTNKENGPYSLNSPEGFLSPKALLRRQKQGISLSGNDLPVTPAYIDSIRATGAAVLTVSKWLNSVTVRADDDSILQKINKLAFVKKELVQQRRQTTGHQGQVAGGVQNAADGEAFDYGVSGWQTIIHKGHILHNQGFSGHGMVIAVIDAGFYHVDQIEAFSSLWENGQILGSHDFVAEGSNVFNGHSHGMVVLSIIGGNLPGELTGTAPDASFWLLRSEDTGSEYPIEEDNWTAAAEFADSAGADIISSSLGYTQFDDPAMNHIYGDMDGNTTRISRAADIAASKGMLVVVSAGNQGANNWHYISAPADADSVMAVGAIDANGIIADFSSRGPSADLRIKPDVVAIGKGTWMADFVSGIRQGNGTSLSAPVIAGLSACLWQTSPGATASEVLTAVKESSNQYTRPDDAYGFGIPDFSLAHVLLKQQESGSQPGDRIIAFPNPFRTELQILFSEPEDEAVAVSLVDLSGRIVFFNQYPKFNGRKYISINQGLQELYKGVYTLKVATGTRISIVKLFKF
jgi:serine protease AprX